MVIAATNKMDLVDGIRSFLQSKQPLNQKVLQETVDLINSGKHPRFPGAKQRINTEQLRKAIGIISSQIDEPDSKVNKGLDIVQKHSNQMKKRFKEIKKQDLDNPTIFSRVKAFFKLLLAQIGFSRSMKKDIKAITNPQI